ncbi:MAG: VWA domain-containing protein [Candidatus Magasanikbacteria bacterium]|nr:VWA domain-containing protein [Candidatus Magasanikbacteria bacterium]
MDENRALVLRGDRDDLARIRTEATISVMVLDRSGSMSRYRSTPQDAVNAHMAQLRLDANNDHFCGVVSFADDARVEVPFGHISTVRPMAGYRADGNTLLWATVHQVMDELWQQYERVLLGKADQPLSLRFVIGVFSDGADNESARERFPVTLQLLAAMAREAGWELLTFGIGIDGCQLAEEMGFPTDEAHAVTVAASVEGVHRASQTFSSATMAGGRRRR